MTATDTPLEAPAKPARMTAQDVLLALHGQWNPAEYVHIHEAPTSSDRAGRKLDALVVSCWKSRGYELDGVEVKVSMSDFKREFDTPAKADWWFDHVHRFWVATPAPLAERLAAPGFDFPSGWGLLSCTTDTPPKVLIKPAKHQPTPLAWTTVVGLFRAAVGSSGTLVDGAERRGYQRGMEAGRSLGARPGTDRAIANELDRLKRTVAEFEAASGIRLMGCWDGTTLGREVALLRHAHAHPDVMARHIQFSKDELERITAQLAALDEVVKGIANGDATTPAQETQTA